MFSTMAVQVCITTKSLKGSLFWTTSPAFIVCKLFDGSHSTQHEMACHCGFDLHFSIMSDVQHPFTWLLDIFMSPLETTLFSCLAHFFFFFLIGSLCLLVLSFMSCLSILEINYLSVYSFAIIFTHSQGCFITLLIVSFVV